MTGKFRADSIETPDDTTVTFNLNTPDTTFVKLLSTATTSIVDEETYPADELLADDQVVGSGPLKLSQYKEGEQVVLEANESYDGDNPAQAPQIFVQFFKDAAPLKEAIGSGQIDVAWRTLGPTDLADLEGNDRRRGDRGRGLGVPLLGLPARHRGRQGPRCPPGRGPAHRPRGHRRERLRRHGRPGSLDRPARLRRAEGLLRGDVRRARRGQGQADPRRGQRGDAGDAHPGLHPDPLRAEHGRRGHRAVQAAQRQRALRDHASSPPSGSSTRRCTRRTPTTCSPWRGTPTSWTPTTTSRRSSATEASSPTATPPTRSTSSSTRSWPRPTRPSATRSSASCRTSPPRTSRWCRRGSARTSPSRRRRCRESRRPSTRPTSSGCGTSARPRDLLI